MKKVAIIVGSLRKESWNRKLAGELMRLAPASLNMDIIEIGQLPHYNQDLDDGGNPPKEWTNFREQMKQYDGVLFATPEYNRSMPAVLKNAIDVGSRPYGKSIWSGKPAAIISSSPGALGGFGSNQHLHQTFVFLDMPCLQQPEAYISNIDKLFDGDKVKDDNVRDFLRKYIEAYAAWVNKF